MLEMSHTDLQIHVLKQDVQVYLTLLAKNDNRSIISKNL